MSALTVVYLAATGHVLAALTRTTGPPDGEPVSALVGDGLPVRLFENSAGVTVPSNLLAAVAVDDDASGVLDDPRSQRVVEELRGGQTVHELISLGPANSVAVDATGVTVGASSVVTATRPVVVVLEQPGTRLVREDAIPVGQNQVEVQVPVAPGTWQVVAFVAGQGLAVNEATV